MIHFECPECGENMEIGDRMAGEQVRCVECDETVDVPEKITKKRKKKRRSVAADDYLSTNEYILYGLVFLVIPCANVILSSILYYSWRAERPTKAGQINVLGFGIFVFQIALRVILGVVLQK